MSDQLDRLAAALKERYELQQEVGRGGMATVYLAHDVRHDRQVAIKVLRPELAASLGSDRFLREIRIAANLHHPHILPVHDSGNADGFLYYVMPYVEGKSLRARIDDEGPLQIGEVVRILKEVADALAHAHQSDVVHRDVKPDNILISGRHVVVTDFGVAKAVTKATDSSDVTTVGVTLGTPAYMSPEQAAADPNIDHRADIYALGVVGYELLTGNPPFSSSTPQEVLSAHVMKTPEPIRAHRSDIPEKLAELIDRCLAKRAEDRWQSAEDLVHLLEGMSTASGGVTPVATRPITGITRLPPRVVKRVALGSVLVVAATLLLSQLPKFGARAARALPEYERLTFLGNVNQGDLSPDGRTIAYLVYEGGRRKLVLQDLSGGAPLTLVDSLQPFSGLMWFPDGTRIAFTGIRDGKRGIHAVPRLGGATRYIMPLLGYWTVGNEKAYQWMTGRRIMLVGDLVTGDTSRITLPDSMEFLYAIAPSPSGGRLAIHSGKGGRETLWTTLPDGSDWQPIVEDSVGIGAPRWGPDGESIYYMRAAAGGFAQRADLMKVELDGDRRRRAGDPRELLSDLHTYATWDFSFSDSMDRLVFPEIRRERHLTLLLQDSTGAYNDTLRLTSGSAIVWRPKVSPDGAWVAYVGETAGGTDVFKMPISGGAAEQLSFLGTVRSSLAWSSEGSRIAFFASRSMGSEPHVWTVSANGGNDRVYGETTPGDNDISWAPHHDIIYQGPDNRVFAILDPETEQERYLIGDESRGWIFNAQHSPTGPEVAAFWNGVDNRGMWLFDTESGSGRPLLTVRISHFGADMATTPYGGPIVWSSDGKGVYMVGTESRWRGRMFYVPVADPPAYVELELPFSIGTPWSASITPDGRAIVVAHGRAVADLAAMTNFDPEAGR
jgi:Tol biopolymer transport system component/tRNA A-37 threonylcarbamoyl transferase component Bud32